MKEFQERLDVERQIWEENYKKEKVTSSGALYSDEASTCDCLSY